jgi:hypothetical protein
MIALMLSNPSRADTVSLSIIGLSIDSTPQVQRYSRQSYRAGYYAFLLGKSEASGRDVFNRKAYLNGWRAAAVMFLRYPPKA